MVKSKTGSTAKSKSNPASKETKSTARKTVRASASKSGTKKTAPKTSPQRSTKARTSSKKNPALPNHDQIATRAYQIWENNGYPMGCEMENWVEAERQLQQSTIA